MKHRLRFWGSAVGAAAAFALLVPLLFPFRALGLDPAVDRPRIWMLAVFCAGVMALMFGLSGALGSRYLGIRDVYFARGVTEAVDWHQKAGGVPRHGGWLNAGVWTLAFGASLIALYFVLSIALN
ncbi:MAG TPA: hypothetical protein VGO40_22330 [Longimicrobium sp.]|jgi:hypothetical protein|nr:hypothetical protein [Longimicrobium sp.]